MDKITVNPKPIHFISSLKAFLPIAHSSIWALNSDNLDTPLYNFNLDDFMLFTMSTALNVDSCK